MGEKKAEGVQELEDEELPDVSGGKRFWEWGGKYYAYTGKQDGDGWRDDWNASYLCPSCGRPVHYGDWYRYYCDACDESWYYESKLVPNIESGVWTEISKRAYEDATRW